CMVLLVAVLRDPIPAGAVARIPWYWCPGEDSNLHGFHHWYLKPARLPIPPPGHGATDKGRPFGLSTPRPRNLYTAQRPSCIRLPHDRADEARHPGYGLRRL